MVLIERATAGRVSVASSQRKVAMKFMGKPVGEAPVGSEAECDDERHATDSPSPAGQPDHAMSPQLEAFILERFRTTLEDPLTGRRVAM